MNRCPVGETGNGENGLVLVLLAGLGNGLWAFRKEQPTGVCGKKYLITDTMRPWVPVRVTGREGWTYGKFCIEPLLLWHSEPSIHWRQDQQLLSGTVQGL